MSKFAKFSLVFFMVLALLLLVVIITAKLVAAPTQDGILNACVGYALTSLFAFLAYFIAIGN